MGERELLTGDGEVDVDFGDMKIRRAFIRKVYSILMAQLAFTSVVVGLFTYHEPTKTFVQTHFFVPILAYVLMIVILIAMACCPEVRRQTPGNYACLAVFTEASSVFLGVIASYYDSELVLMATALTCAICFALTLYAFQTAYDFTVIGAGLFIALLVLVLLGIVAIFLPGKTITMVYASLGVILFSLYLIYDTQLMMGGKHKYSISPEEYIFAALNLYLDVVNIFIFLLSLLGNSGK